MNIIGKIIKINETETLKNNYKKRKFYIDRSRKDQFSDKVYTNFNEVTLLGESKITLIDSYFVGDVVEIACDINGNFFTHENEEKFSQELNCWGITLKKKSDPPQNQQGNGSSVYQAK